MIFSRKKSAEQTQASNSETESLGLGLKPGQQHYRAYIGPPEDYDLVAAMTFNLLTTLGLRQHHKLLDIGCGSLRNGRLLIPYLNAGNYAGIEPNQWLVEEGIKREIGADLIRIKNPKLYFAESADVLKGNEIKFDFAVAQSIFSHCGMDLINRWLTGLSPFLSSEGALVATFLIDREDFQGSGWVYPDCVKFKIETMNKAASSAGFKFEILDWRHPRQTWALFAKSQFDSSWFKDKPLTWNTSFDFARA